MMLQWMPDHASVLRWFAVFKYFTSLTYYWSQISNVNKQVVLQ